MHDEHVDGAQFPIDYLCYFTFALATLSEAERDIVEDAKPRKKCTRLKGHGYTRRLLHSARGFIFKASNNLEDSRLAASRATNEADKFVFFHGKRDIV